MTASITDLGQRSEPTAAPAVVAHCVWSSGIDSPVSRAAFRWRSRSTSWHPLAPDHIPIDPDEYPVVGERITAAELAGDLPEAVAVAFDPDTEPVECAADRLHDVLEDTVAPIPDLAAGSIAQ